MSLKEIFAERKTASEARYNAFKIEEIASIRRISEDTYLESPTWLGGDNEFVCLFIDLDKSSALSFKHHIATMAKIYDYFTQNVVDILSMEPFKADYIDIKGDGAFGIYEGPNATYKALCAALTFKTFFEDHIRPKFQGQTGIMNCKISIEKDKILVKRIGKRGDNNEVWAGRVVNNASKLAGLSKDIYESDSSIEASTNSLIVISDKVYLELKNKAPYTTISCGHDIRGNKTASAISNWKSFDCSQNENINCERAWYCGSRWCDLCGDKYLNEILK